MSPLLFRHFLPSIISCSVLPFSPTHPSQFKTNKPPSYRGAAPLQHAIINGTQKTGITLQTLSPTSFDRGAILSQTPPLHIFPGTTYPQLLQEVIPKAASLLLEGLKAKLYIPPVIDISPYLDQSKEKQKLKLAPKITSKDSEINWEKWGAEDLVRRQNALGRLWSTIWKPVVPIAPPPKDQSPSKKVHNFTIEKKKKTRDAHVIFQPYFEILSRERVRDIFKNTRKEASSVGEFRVYETLFSKGSDSREGLELSKPADPKSSEFSTSSDAVELSETPTMSTTPEPTTITSTVDPSKSSNIPHTPTSSDSSNTTEPPLQKILWFNNGQAAVFLHKGHYIQVVKLILGGQPIGNAREVLLPFSRRVRDLWAYPLEENEAVLEREVGFDEKEGEREEEDWDWDEDGGRFVRRVRSWTQEKKGDGNL